MHPYILRTSADQILHKIDPEVTDTVNDTMVINVPLVEYSLGLTPDKTKYHKLYVRIN